LGEDYFFEKIKTGELTMRKKFRTYQLALKLYKKTRTLKLMNPLRDQFNRASLSIVLNLAEGVSKPTVKDRVKFYHISLASLRECQAVIDILEDERLLQEFDILGAHIWKLINNPGYSIPITS